ncbi:hypothetical Protein YC6258_04032 [Gynuella sunshinyii YC6258]|uniref:Uncharacterized protein n=1 Tax=Gynuella sunshinyii YC6258 TaxID=1445510 RepID=A0A0C5VRR5_9GAMM|nr:hypothetical Protein YC6258_04032 [Gynuella sunshinyii YC6258]
MNKIRMRASEFQNQSVPIDWRFSGCVYKYQTHRGVDSIQYLSKDRLHLQIDFILNRF